ncbi:MAG: hypothetical protein AAGJ18_11975 [Bacteroidota bacterium]
MNLQCQLSRLDRVDALIRRKATGTPEQLARRLELSERRVYQIINLMKALGGPIFFDRERNSYCYEYELVM